MAACHSSGCVSSIVTGTQTIYLSVVSPAAVPHVVTEDIVYAGYFIPKGLCYSLLRHVYLRAPLPGAMVIGNTWYAIFSMHSKSKWLKLFAGRFCMTLPCIQSQMTSNRSDSSTQMEACATTQYWRLLSDMEDESAPEDTFLTRPCSL